MIGLVILIIFGIGVGVFATQNTQNTSVVFGQYGLVDIPLYFVVLAAILFGIFVSWLISLVGMISTSLTLRSKDGRIRDSMSRIEKLEQRNHDLETENAELKSQKNREQHVTREESHHPNPFVKLRQRFS